LGGFGIFSTILAAICGADPGAMSSCCLRIRPAR
jgi:hypothetical protein